MTFYIIYFDKWFESGFHLYFTSDLKDSRIKLWLSITFYIIDLVPIFSFFSEANRYQ